MIVHNVQRIWNEFDSWFGILISLPASSVPETLSRSPPLLLRQATPIVTPTTVYAYSAYSADLDYLPGVYSGILFTSTFYLFIYSAVSGNKPKVYPKIILPGILSGLLWGVAMGKAVQRTRHIVIMAMYTSHSWMVPG